MLPPPFFYVRSRARILRNGLKSVIFPRSMYYKSIPLVTLIICHEHKATLSPFRIYTYTPPVARSDVLDLSGLIARGGWGLGISVEG